MKEKKDLNILVIQAREPQMKKHELDLIIETSGLSSSNFESHNIVSDEIFDLKKLAEYDAVMIGGSGKFTLSEGGVPQLDFMEDVVRYCRENDIPFLGLCFGMQIAVQALGGKIIRDRENMEAGTYSMYRTSDSDSDPLIGGFQREFKGACGRKDRAENLPEGMVNYVKSDRCPYHYVTYPGSNFFATQFHPELWRKSDNLIRVNYYREKYHMTDEEFEKQIALFEDAPESKNIISNFIEKIVLPRYNESSANIS